MLALEGVTILDLSKVIGITAKLADVPASLQMYQQGENFIFTHGGTQ